MLLTVKERAHFLLTGFSNSRGRITRLEAGRHLAANMKMGLFVLVLCSFKLSVLCFLPVLQSWKALSPCSKLWKEFHMASRAEGGSEGETDWLFYAGKWNKEWGDLWDRETSWTENAASGLHLLEPLFLIFFILFHFFFFFLTYIGCLKGKGSNTAADQRVFTNYTINHFASWATEGTEILHEQQ